MTGDLARAEVTPHFKPEKTVKLAVRQKPAKRESEPKTVSEERAAWYAAVTAKRLSAIWTAEDYPAIAAGEKVKFHAHHIVSQQQLRKQGLSPWGDARNGVLVTARRHERHHARVEPIHRSELPDEIYAFLTDYPKLQPWFDKTYPERTS